MSLSVISSTVDQSVFDSKFCTSSDVHLTIVMIKTLLCFGCLAEADNPKGSLTVCVSQDNQTTVKKSDGIDSFFAIIEAVINRLKCGVPRVIYDVSKITAVLLISLSSSSYFTHEQSRVRVILS